MTVRPPQHLDDDFWMSLRRLTAARIGLARSGASLATGPLLDLKLAHSRARDAVHEPLNMARLAADLTGLSDPVLSVESAAEQRLQYLMRPDLGRRLNARAKTTLKPHAGQWNVAFIVADGLSARAVQTHARQVLTGAIKTLRNKDWQIAPLVIVRHGRVGVGDAVAAKGGSFVDANLMGAVSIYGAAVPLYCSGDGAARFAELFAPLGFSIELAGPDAGTAAAVKMLRSVVTKGMEALIVEALTAASLAGVRSEALRGICEPMDATRYSQFVDMCVRTDVLHAERRAVEMDGVAEGLREIGLQPIMTEATAARLRTSAGLGLRADFASRQAYSADDVLDAYAARMSGLPHP